MLEAMERAGPIFTGADLLDPVQGRQFDVALFNAPRVETAGAYVRQVRSILKPEGVALLMLHRDYNRTLQTVAKEAGLEELEEEKPGMVTSVVFVEDLAVDKRRTLPEAFELAVHETLADSLQSLFPERQLLLVSQDREQAKQDLHDFTIREGIQRFIVLDRKLFDRPTEAVEVLPPLAPPTFLISKEEATLLNEAVAATLLELEKQRRIPVGGILILRLRRDEDGQILLSIFA